MKRGAIAAMGTGLGPDILALCRALFDTPQSAVQAAMPVMQGGIAYRPHERHRLDRYAPRSATRRSIRR